jgi:hypothetical protein
MLLSDALQDAVWGYYDSHYPILKGYRSIGEFLKSFHEEGVVLNNYLSRLPPSEHMIANAVLNRKNNRDYLLMQIRSQIARTVFRNNGYYSVSVQGDDVVQRAVQILSSPQYPQLIGR